MESSTRLQHLSAGILLFFFFPDELFGFYGLHFPAGAACFHQEKNKGKRKTEHQKKKKLLVHKCQTTDLRSATARWRAWYFSQEFEQNKVKIERNFGVKAQPTHKKENKVKKKKSSICIILFNWLIVTPAFCHIYKGFIFFSQLVWKIENTCIIIIIIINIIIVI